MRENAGSWIIKILFGFLVLTFISWGGYTEIGGCSEEDVALVINEKSISKAEYQKIFEQKLEERKRMYPQAFQGDLSKQMEEFLKKQISESIVTETLMRAKTQELDLTISKKELSDLITKLDVFKNEETKQFDINIYKKLLQVNRLTPGQFESQEMERMQMKRLVDLISHGVVVSENELKDEFKVTQTLAKIGYFSLNEKATPYLEAVDEKELTDYFEKNKESFKAGEKRKFGYIGLSVADLFKDTKIDTDDANQYFDENMKDEEKKWGGNLTQISRIMIKEGEHKTEQMNEALKALSTGKTFHEVAYSLSSDYFAKNGGRMGFLSEDEIKVKFSNEALPKITALGIGNISKPIPLKNGVALVLVEDRLPAGEVSFSRLGKAASVQVQLDNAKKNLKTEAEALALSLSKSGKSIESYARENNLTHESVDFFAKDEKIARDIDFGWVKSKIFETSKDAFTPAIRVSADYYIVAQVTGTSPPAAANFGEVKDKVEERFRSEKSKTLFKQKLDVYANDLKKGKSVETMAKELKAEILQTDFFAFSERSTIAGIGTSKELMQAVMKGNAGENVPAHFKVGEKTFFVKILEKKLPDWNEYAKEKKSLKAKLIDRKKNTLLSNWQKNLTSSAKIQKSPEIGT
jgi:peptidyl-prolyl cis-trans isomerase D